MKKYFAGILIFTCLGSFSWSAAQGAKADLFDVLKSQQELEIMKGILSTTLSFVAQSLQKQSTAQAGTRGTTTPFGSVSVYSSGLRFSNMNAFYLYGQGAVFVIPSSTLRSSSFFSGRNLIGYDSGEFAALEKEMQNLSGQYATATREYARQQAAAEKAAATAQDKPKV